MCSDNRGEVRLLGDISWGLSDVRFLREILTQIRTLH